MIKVCPKLKSQGSCSDSSCIYRHDVHVCEDCSLVLDSADLFQQHMRSKSHKRHASGVPLEQVAPSVSGYCALCRTPIEPKVWHKHLQTHKHRAREKYAAFKSALEEGEKNKHGVVVSDGIDFGVVAPADAREGVTVQFNLQTTVPNSRIKIVSAKLFSLKASRS